MKKLSVFDQVANAVDQDKGKNGASNSTAHTPPVRRIVGAVKIPGPAGIETWELLYEDAKPKSVGL